MKETKQVEIMPTPKEILLKYLEPIDNTYMKNNIKEAEDRIVVLKEIMANPKKLEKHNKASENSLLGKADSEIEYLNGKIEQYNRAINKGMFRHAGRSNVVKTLELYEDKPCVAAGVIENLMGLFIIRGKVKSFAFVVQKGDFWIGGYSYKIGFVSIEDFFKIFENIKNNPTTGNGVANVYSQELYDQIKKEILVKAIEGK
jgi:hypothetical protein